MMTMGMMAIVIINRKAIITRKIIVITRSLKANIITSSLREITMADLRSSPITRHSVRTGVIMINAPAWGFWGDVLRSVIGIELSFIKFLLTVTRDVSCAALQDWREM